MTVFKLKNAHVLNLNKLFHIHTFKQLKQHIYCELLVLQLQNVKREIRLDFIMCTH